jgi:hypothetical protein
MDPNLAELILGKQRFKFIQIKLILFWGEAGRCYKGRKSIKS